MDAEKFDSQIPSDISESEKLKFKIEFERIKIEWYKTWGTIASIAIPLFLVFATNYYGKWLENERAKSSFQLKAMEIIMNSEPCDRKIKAVVLYELYPEQLPLDLVDRITRLYPEVLCKY